MRKIFPLTILLLSVLFLSACSPDQTTDSALIGTKAPDFTLENTQGGETSLSEFQGTPVLLFFHMAVG